VENVDDHLLVKFGTSQGLNRRPAASNLTVGASGALMTGL
jgi:hypothetical protein